MARKFNLDLECENQAFSTDGEFPPLESAAGEVARILRELADRLDGRDGALPAAPEAGSLLDFNGLTVGHFEFSGFGGSPADVQPEGRHHG